MSQVLITCPVSGEEVPTGISLPPELFEEAVFADNSVTCPACGQVHVWSKEDAFLRNGDGPGQAADG